MAKLQNGEPEKKVYTPSQADDTRAWLRKRARSAGWF